jgi:hypothetical protein
VRRSKRRVRWLGNIERMRQIRNAYKILVDKSQGWNLLGDLGTGERIILKFVFKKIGCELRSAGSRQSSKGLSRMVYCTSGFQKMSVI